MITPSSSSVAPEVRSKSGRLLPLLVILLFGVAGVGAFFWWRQHAFQRFLETASIEELAAAAPQHLEETEIFIRLGVKAKEAEQWPRSAKAFRHAAELSPDRREAWVGWSRATYEFADFRAADAILTDFIHRHPDDGRAYLERAALRRDAKQRESAFNDADKATQLDPKSGEAWAIRGDLCLDMGIPGEGENSFLKARELLPNSAWPYVGLYQAYIAQKKDSEALETAQTINKRFPTVVENRLYLGEAQLVNAKTPADYDATRKTLQEAERSEATFRPMDKFALYQLMGQSYYNQQRYKEAKVYLEKAESIMSGNPDLLFILGRTYRAVGDTALAEATMSRHKKAYEDTAKARQFQARIKNDPTNAALRLEFAHWYIERGLLPSAKTQYEEMILRGLEVETAKREIQALEKHDSL